MLLRRFVHGVYSDSGPDNARCIFGHMTIFRSGNPVPYNHLNLFGHKRELCPSDTGPDCKSDHMKECIYFQDDCKESTERHVFTLTTP